jgi:hypothetical protein
MNNRNISRANSSLDGAGIERRDLLLGGSALLAASAVTAGALVTSEPFAMSRTWLSRPERSAASPAKGRFRRLRCPQAAQSAGERSAAAPTKVVAHWILFAAPLANASDSHPDLQRAAQRTLLYTSICRTARAKSCLAADRRCIRDWRSRSRSGSAHGRSRSRAAGCDKVAWCCGSTEG